MSWDPCTFPQALGQASCVHPQLTNEDIDEIFDGETWSGPEVMSLVFTAVEANTTRRVVDLGNV